MSEITRRAFSPADLPGTKGPKTATGVRVGTIVLPNGSYDEDGLPDVRIPAEVVRRGVRFLEDRVRGRVEIVNGDGGTEEEEDE
jgi:hypothetical protein